jgi:hypothetical protein
MMESSWYRSASGTALERLGGGEVQRIDLEDLAVEADAVSTSPRSFS